MILLIERRRYMKKFEDMKIGKKLLIGFLSVAFIAVIIGVFGEIVLMKVAESDQTLYHENTLVLESNDNATNTFLQIRYQVLKMTTLTDLQAIKETISRVEDLKRTLGEYLNNSDQLIQTAEFHTMNDQIRTLWEEGYVKKLDLIATFALSGDYEAAQAELPAIAQVGNDTQAILLRFSKMLTDDGDIMANENLNLAKTSGIIMVAVIIAGIAITIMLTIKISGMISKPLNKATMIADMLAVGDIDTGKVITNEDILYFERKDEIGALFNAFDRLISGTKKQVEAAKRIAEGDLSVSIEIRSEYDMLGLSFDELTKGLRNIIESIRCSADMVASGSNAVSDSSQLLSQGASEQASAVQQLSAALEELANKTAENAQNASKANELADNSKTLATKGNDQMDVVRDAMTDINVSSNNISQIIKIIDDIAFQTNILALNAAVEAARAGAYGKGFAVVADAVRMLASKSADAAKKIADMIEQSIRKVESGMRISAETADVLKWIVSEVEKSAALVNDIAISSNVQAVGITQIKEGVIQISQVIQTNAATSEESAAASEELSTQASQLRDTVSIFQTSAAQIYSQKDRRRSKILLDRVPDQKKILPERTVFVRGNALPVYDGELA